MKRCALHNGFSILMAAMLAVLLMALALAPAAGASARGPGMKSAWGRGQEAGLRSGTLNVPGIIGMAKSRELCLAEQPAERERLRQLRNRLYAGITDNIAGVRLNGPALDRPDWRLPHNLNLRFAGLDGESLMLTMRELAVSSGSACTAASPEPSHVLRAIGLGEDDVRGSLRFGLGRFNTADEIEFAIETVERAVKRLRDMHR